MKGCASAIDIYVEDVHNDDMFRLYPLLLVFLVLRTSDECSCFKKKNCFLRDVNFFLDY